MGRSAVGVGGGRIAVRVGGIIVGVSVGTGGLWQATASITWLSRRNDEITKLMYFKSLTRSLPLWSSCDGSSAAMSGLIQCRRLEIGSYRAISPIPESRTQCLALRNGHANPEP